MRIADRLNGDDARELLANCCGSARWVAEMLARRPFADDEAVVEAAYQAGESLTDDDWLEAFAAHPQIGDVESLRKKYAATKEIAAGEQAGVAGAHAATLVELAQLNREYLKCYGFIFIVFATGKSAQQMLTILRSRLGNCREEELQTAAEEQMKITQLRLKKLGEETL